MSPQHTPTLGELTRAECLDLLASQQFGRLGVIVAGAPDIFPVNYALDGDNIAIRTDWGTKLTAAGLRRVVFEVDHIDSASQQGWSVVVKGVAYDITDAIDERSVHTRTAHVVPWAPGAKDRWIRILHPEFSGRRLTQSTTSR